MSVMPTPHRIPIASRALERHPPVARDPRLARLRRRRRRPGHRRPDPRDRRRRLPAGRVRAAPTRWSTTAGLDEPRHRERADHRAGRRGSSTPPPAEAAAAAIVAGHGATSRASTRSPRPQPSPDRSALLVSVQLARDQEDVAALQDVTAAASRRDHPELRSARPATSPRRRHQRPGRRGPRPPPRASASRSRWS